MNLPVVDKANLSGKKVFVRGDIDVPLESLSDQSKSKIVDDTRLKDIWPTLKYLLDKDSKLILGGHLGKPGGKEDPKLSSRPVAEWFQSKIVGAGLVPAQNDAIGATTRVAPTEEINIGSFKGFRVTDDFFVLENLRFDPREEANDEGLAKELASLAEVFVNESFAEAHKTVASTVGVPKLLPHYAGFRLAKELKVLSGILDNPERPLVCVIGGAKLETKIPVIAKMAQVADVVIVGGKLLCEIKSDSEIAKNPKVKLLELTKDTKDCTLPSVDQQLDILRQAATIVWNGPLGMVEDYPYQVGTRRLAEIIAGTSSYKVVGGGDTIGFLDKLGLTEKFDWACSGGGAMLEFLAGKGLPGVEALLV